MARVAKRLHMLQLLEHILMCFLTHLAQKQPPPHALRIYFAMGERLGTEPEARGTFALRAHFLGNKRDVWVRGWQYNLAGSF